MKYYAVIDTNVLVSALLKSHSIPGSIVKLAFEGIIIPVLNESIEKEYCNVLSRPKFHLPKSLIDDVIKTFRRCGFYVDAAKLAVTLPDPDDIIFYEAVAEKRKETNAYLVTGNIKHFPQKNFIVTPREMLELILRDQGLLQRESPNRATPSERSTRHLLQRTRRFAPSSSERSESRDLKIATSAALPPPRNDTI